MSFIQEFKKFAMRGNVIDMAVGIVLGGAFGSIVSSFVSDVLMPPIGLLLGKVDFSSLHITLRQATADAPAVMISYGTFINTVISFIIIAFSVFLVVRFVNRLEHKKAEEPAAPPAPTAEEKLLAEIRDLLNEKK